LFFIVSGYGLSELAAQAPRPAIPLGMILALSYALHIPFSMPLDKKVQETIEVGVRERAGYSLAGMMKNPDDRSFSSRLDSWAWPHSTRPSTTTRALARRWVRATKNLSPPE
jgi:hypothetical protein